MNNEYRNPIVERCIQELDNGNWPFEGLDDQTIVQLVKGSDKLLSTLRTRIGNDLTLLAKLPSEVVALLLQSQQEAPVGDETAGDNNHQFHLMKIIKRVSSALGLFLTLPLLQFVPLGPIAFAIGVIPLISGIIGNEVWRNAFRPMKLLWLLCSLILSTELTGFYGILLLVVGIFILMNDKVSINWKIPPKGEDAVIFSSNTLTVFGIPLPWRKFTVERKGGILRITLVEALMGGDRSQAFLYMKDPEVKSSAAEVLLGGFQYLTLKSTSHDGEVFRVRLPDSLVSAIAESGILSTLCELAKRPEETAVITHSHT